MIERFEVGKKYRWIGGKERPGVWNSEGSMDFLLDGEPHECTKANNERALAGFLGHENPGSSDGCWGFLSTAELFEEVKE